MAQDRIHLQALVSSGFSKVLELPESGEKVLASQ